MSVIRPMKKFDPLPIPFQSVPIETESEKIGTQLIGIGIGVTRYLDAFPNMAYHSLMGKISYDIIMMTVLKGKIFAGLSCVMTIVCADLDYIV